MWQALDFVFLLRRCIFFPWEISLSRANVIGNRIHFEWSIDNWSNYKTIKDTGHYWLLSKTSHVLVYLNMHKTTNLGKSMNSTRPPISEIIMEEKTPLSHKVVCFEMPWFRDLKIKFWGLKIKFVENCFFLKNYNTSDSEGAISHNILYYWVITNSV